MLEILFIILTLAGLSLFEIVTSVDNAVINADVLSTMSKKARRWFLVYGMFFAVFVVRGLLPFAIILMINPSLGFGELITSSFSGDKTIQHAIEQSAPPLLIGGGVFLIFLFLHWIFMQPKNYAHWGEKYIHKKAVWFYAIVSVSLSLIIWFSIKTNPMMAFGAAMGSTAFFIVHGFKQNAEYKERELMDTKMSDISKIMYLEVIDTTFSIDGVLGAFAFTLVVPFILIGNGIGAIVVRQITISNIDRIKKYKYIKNGAMYSVAILGVIMILESFSFKIPPWISPIATIGILAFFFLKSKKELRRDIAVID